MARHRRKLIFVAVLGLLAGWLGYTRIRYDAACLSMDGAKTYVHAWAMGDVVQELSRDEPLEVWARKVPGLDVEVVSLELRSGPLGHLTSKVEYTVNGGPPPDGQRYHYYTMKHSLLSGGYLGRAYETPAFLYRFALWRGCRSKDLRRKAPLEQPVAE